jgi:hypothetical protein
MQGVGTGGGRGGQAPPSFAKCPFSGSKVPFSWVKNVIKIAFFAQRALLKTWIYVISENFFSFPEKLSYIRKIFWYIRKIFFIFRKKYDISWKFFGMSRKIFLHALFYSKSASQRLPPPAQLLEASYDPGLMLSKALLRSIMTIAVNFFSSIALKICLPLPDLMSQSSGISDYHFDAESICYFVSGSCEIGQKQYSLQP